MSQLTRYQNQILNHLYRLHLIALLLTMHVKWMLWRRAIFTFSSKVSLNNKSPGSKVLKFSITSLSEKRQNIKSQNFFKTMKYCKVPQHWHWPPVSRLHFLRSLCKSLWTQTLAGRVNFRYSCHLSVSASQGGTKGMRVCASLTRASLSHNVSVNVREVLL